MLTTLNAITPIFLIIATGYLLFRFRVVNESVWSAIEHICFYLLLPALIVRTLSRANLLSVPVIDFMMVLIVAILGMSVLLILTHRLFRKRYPKSGPSFSSLFQGATRFHGFVAIAIIGPLYGDQGITLAALALAIMVPLLNITSVIVLSIYGHSEVKPATTAVLWKILTNPLIIACVIGLLLNWLGIPDVLFETIDIIGAGGLAAQAAVDHRRADPPDRHARHYHCHVLADRAGRPGAHGRNHCRGRPHRGLGLRDGAQDGG